MKRERTAPAAKSPTATTYPDTIDYGQSSTTSRAGATVFSAAVFLVPAAAVLAATWSVASFWTIALAALVGLLAFMSVHIAFEWEKAVIMRLGKFNRVAGPGIYFTSPVVVAEASKIDPRGRTIAFDAEETLSSDLVPVNVDTVLFWVVWDVERACKQVRNFEAIISLAAQTAMRDVIGQLNLADISMRRKQIDRDLEEILGKKCEQWGVTVMSVEIRDITIPKELQDALSKEAQAERERNARIILAEVEKDISEMFVEAAEVYDRNPRAMKLRAMNLAYEGAKDSKGVLLAPSALADGFNVVQPGGRE